MLLPVVQSQIDDSSQPSILLNAEVSHGLMPTCVDMRGYSIVFYLKIVPFQKLDLISTAVSESANFADKMKLS